MIKVSQVNPTSIQAIHRFDLARKVPIGGEISFKDLAKKCDLYEPDLRRIIRFAMSFHRLFREPRRGFITHSAASSKLAEDRDFHNALGLVFNEFVPSYARVSLCLKFEIFKILRYILDSRRFGTIQRSRAMPNC